VSRTTVVLAYEQLLAEGYLETRPASGTFVSPILPQEAAADQADRSTARGGLPTVALGGQAAGSRSGGSPDRRAPAAVRFPARTPGLASVSERALASTGRSTLGHGFERASGLRRPGRL
jgi:DNA-binding transcriptional MocR family regulator